MHKYVFKSDITEPSSQRSKTSCSISSISNSITAIHILLVKRLSTYLLQRIHSKLPYSVLLAFKNKTQNISICSVPQ